MIANIDKLIRKFECFIAPMASPVADLILRLAVAHVFLLSGMAKLKNLQGAGDLFQYEWFSDENWWMQLLGFEEIPRVLAMILAVLSAAAEFVLPLLLIVGLFTRFAASGLMAVALVIVLLVYPVWTEDGLALWWSEHLWWVGSLLALMAFGGQKFSADHWLKSRK